MEVVWVMLWKCEVLHSDYWMSHAIVIFEEVSVSTKDHNVFSEDKLHVRSGNDNNGSFCWRNLREHEVGQGDGTDGELWVGSGVLRGNGADDPQAADHHRRPHAQVQVAAREYLLLLCSFSIVFFIGGLPWIVTFPFMISRAK